MFNWFVFVGLIGVTIVITMSYTFYKISEYMGSFNNKWNPLRYISELISCPLMFGFIIGFLYVFYVDNKFIDGIVCGGLIGMISFVVYNFLEILKKVSGAYSPKESNVDNILHLLEEEKKKKSTRVLKSKNERMGLSEKEAHSVLENQDKEDEFMTSF